MAACPLRLSYIISFTQSAARFRRCAFPLAFIGSRCLTFGTGDQLVLKRRFQPCDLAFDLF